MKAQLDALLEARELATVQIQVMPLSVGAYAEMTGAFYILDFPDSEDPEIVYIETTGGDIIAERSEQVTNIKLVFEHLRADALGKEESSQLIRSISVDFTQKIEGKE